MIDIFLRAKHWHLFLIKVILPLVLQFAALIAVFMRLWINREGDPMIAIGYLKMVPVLALFFSAISFGWYWSIAIGLQDRLPPTVKMNVRKFKVFFFIPVVYMIVIFSAISIAFDTFFPLTPEGIGWVLIVFAFIFPVHLFCVFCIFYCLYFVAKTVKTAELQREVGFSEFSTEFFLIWLFPVGVWFVQPRINRMANG
ncbi:MAG TPA: hypothetical protein VEB86_13780 [Chryseosolibacter sp.]|nr:hypothetical protein [Chryseosolibacter sp.]